MLCLQSNFHAEHVPYVDSPCSNDLTQLLINHKQYLNVSCLIIYKITYLS